MIKTIAQIKALISATAPSERLDLLTEVYLDTDSEEIERFTENYRMLLGSSHRKGLKKDVARISGIIEKALIPSKETSDEVHGGEL